MEIIEAAAEFAAYCTTVLKYSSLTASAYSTDLGDFARYLAGNWLITRIEAVEPYMVKGWLGDLRLGNKASTTIHRKTGTLRSFFRFCVKFKGLTRNPMRTVSSIKREKHYPQFFSEPEINDLLEFLRQRYNKGKTTLALRDLCIVELLTVTGLRVSELVNLGRSSCDFSAHVLRVSGKGGKTRLVPFTPTACELLQRYCQLTARWNFETVFLNSSGNPLTRRGVFYILTERMKEFGGKSHIHPHKLRHTFATLLLSNGADIRLIQKLMGHASLASSEVYTHLDIARIRALYRNFHPHS